MERRPGVPAADPRRAGARWKSEIKSQTEKGQPENHQLNRCARRRSCPPTKRRRKEAREKRRHPKCNFRKGPQPAKTWKDVQGWTVANSNRAKTHFMAHASEANVHHRGADEKSRPKTVQTGPERRAQEKVQKKPKTENEIKRSKPK